MTKKGKFKIEFAKQEMVKETAYQLIEDLFGIRGVFLSDESTLDDFVIEMDIPGHKLIPFSEVSKSEKHLYKKLHSAISAPSKYHVWYPPLASKESESINKATRRQLLMQIEAGYGISLEDYPKKRAFVCLESSKTNCRYLICI